MEPGKVFLFNSCPVDQRPFHFHTIEILKRVDSVKWISENRVALGISKDGGIQIWEIDESTKSTEIVQRFQHVDGEVSFVYPLTCTLWLFFFL
jgi:WD40 repeat protein